ncbi:RING finger and WD repeat domain-containing protein 3, variant 2 [Balamuthia mandrillaris]
MPTTRNGSASLIKRLGSRKKCPTCQMKAKKADIRVLFCQSVKLTAIEAVNTEQKPQKQQQQELSTVNKKLEAKLKKLQTENEQLRKEQEQLTAKFLNARVSVARLQKAFEQEKTKRIELQRTLLWKDRSATTAQKPSTDFIDLTTPSTNTSDVTIMQTSPASTKTLSPSCSSSTFSSSPQTAHISQEHIALSPPTSFSSHPSSSSSSSSCSSTSFSRSSPSFSTPPVTLTAAARATLPIASHPLHSIDSSSYRTLPPIKLSKSRVLDISKEGFLLASSATPSFTSSSPSPSPSSSWGLLKVSLLDPTSHQDYIPDLHREAIRDIRWSASHGGLILTGSLDRTIKLTSTRTNSVVLSYALDGPVWACQWKNNNNRGEQTDCNENDNDNLLYCAANNTLYLFDIRQTRSFVASATPCHQPIHSILSLSAPFFLPVDATSSALLENDQQKEMLLVGSCEGLFTCSLESGATTSSTSAQPQSSSFKLPLRGGCTSVSFDVASRHCAASFRSMPYYHFSAHTVFGFEDTTVDSRTQPERERGSSRSSSSASVPHQERTDNVLHPHLKELRTIYTGSKQRLLSRSQLFSIVEETPPSEIVSSSSSSSSAARYCQRLIMAAANEETKAVVLWDCGRGECIRQLEGHYGSPVTDVSYFQEGSSHFVASLSEEQLLLHQLS